MDKNKENIIIVLRLSVACYLVVRCSILKALRVRPYRRDTLSARIFSASPSAFSALALAASAPFASCLDTPRFCSSKNRSSVAFFSRPRNDSFSPLFGEKNKTNI